jgi:hypothetical protein
VYRPDLQGGKFFFLGFFLAISSLKVSFPISGVHLRDTVLFRLCTFHWGAKRKTLFTCLDAEPGGRFLLDEIVGWRDL